VCATSRIAKVANGKVVARYSVKSLDELARQLGPGTEPALVRSRRVAKVGFVHDKLVEWGHDAKMLDTDSNPADGGRSARAQERPDRCRSDREALDSGHIARGARAFAYASRAAVRQLSVRRPARGDACAVRDDDEALARAAGVLLPTVRHVERRRKDRRVENWTRRPRALVAPLCCDAEDPRESSSYAVEATLAAMAEKDSESSRFWRPRPAWGSSSPPPSSRPRRSHALQERTLRGAYLGLVPSESHDRRPTKRRLGSITKQGNRRSAIHADSSCVDHLSPTRHERPAQTLGHPRRRDCGTSARRRRSRTASSPACSGHVGATGPSTTQGARREVRARRRA